MAEHTADTEQFPWSQHATLSCGRFQLRNKFLLGTKNLVPNPFLIWSFYCSLNSLLNKIAHSDLIVHVCFQPDNFIAVRIHKCAQTKCNSVTDSCR